MREKIEGRIQAGYTAADIAAELGAEVRRGAVVLPGWTAWDDGGEPIEFPDADASLEAAQEYVAGGDYDVDRETVGVHVRARRIGIRPDDDGDPEEVEVDWDSHLILEHPDEPTCDASTDGEHEWAAPQALVGGIAENPGVWGRGGASIESSEVCVLCGTRWTRVSASQGVELPHDHTIERYESDAIEVSELAPYHLDSGDSDPERLDSESQLARELRDQAEDRLARGNLESGEIDGCADWAVSISDEPIAGQYAVLEQLGPDWDVTWEPSLDAAKRRARDVAATCREDSALGMWLGVSIP